jgi:hypothetical protein
MANKLLKTLNFGGEDTYYVAPKWENIEDRPFGETTTYGDTLTWDGNTEGLEYVDMGGGVLMYRVSETLPTESDFANGGHAVVKAPQVPDGMPVEFETLTAQDGAISFNDGGVLVALEDLAMGGMSIPKGVYFMDASAVGGSTTCSLTINGYTGFECTKTVPLPNKYLDIIETVGGDTLTWDGDTEGLTVDSTGILFKVSDLTPTAEMFADGITVKLSTGDVLPLSVDEISIDETGVHTGTAFVVYENGVGVDLGDGLSFTETGIYFINDGETYVTSLTINGYTGFTKEQVKQEYLPSGATVFYLGDSETYFYVDKECTTVATKEDVVNAVGGSIRIEGEGTVFNPIVTEYYENYGMIVLAMYYDGQLMGMPLYTAEYTG